MKSEDDGAHREELAAFLATAPEHLKPWADEQLAELATGDDGPGESAAEPEFSPMSGRARMAMSPRMTVPVLAPATMMSPARRRTSRTCLRTMRDRNPIREPLGRLVEPAETTPALRRSCNGGPASPA